jgi:hypothetical protein
LSLKKLFARKRPHIFPVMESAIGLKALVLAHTQTRRRQMTSRKQYSGQSLGVMPRLPPCENAQATSEFGSFGNQLQKSRRLQKGNLSVINYKKLIGEKEYELAV